MHSLLRFLACSLVLSTGVLARDSAMSVTVKDGRLAVAGLTLAAEPAPASYQCVPGPLPGVTGLKASGAPVTVCGSLVTPVQDTGALSFWFMTDRAYRSGTATSPVTRKLVEVAQTLAVSFIADPTSVTLIVEWGGPREKVFPRHIRIILPEFPGPAWHYFAVSWNGRTGEINAFLDGTPYFILGEKVAPLDLLPGDGLVLHLSEMALADVQLAAASLSSGALAAAVPAAYRGRLDRLLGAEDLGPLSAGDRRGELLYARRLGSAADTTGWVLEGPGEINYRDGWMEMKSRRPDGPEGHLVNWCPQVFPDRFVAEWEFELLGEKGLCILFFAANGHDGWDLFDPRLAPRAGVFTQYTEGDIDCYHISYFANTPNEPRRVANLRKNHGFYLIANGPIGVVPAQIGESHRALLIKNGAHIQMAVDGRKIIDYVDDGRRAGPVYTDGRIGFRQMQWTAARYRNFRVSALK